MALTLGKGVFDQLDKNIKQMTDDHENGFAPQRPVGSAVRYLGDLPLLHWGLFQLFGTQLDVSEEVLGGAFAAAGRVLESAALPFDRWIVKKHEVAHDSFIIPPNLDETATTSNKVLVSMLAAWVFGINNELFPPGSWPWTLARETVFVASGMGKYTQMEMGRTYMSPQTGPIGFLVAAKLLTYINQPLSRAFAAKGLKTLTSNDFHKDWSLLVAEDRLLSQCLDHMVQGLQNLDDLDLNRVLTLFPKAQEDLIRDLVKGRNENETEPIHQVLAPVLAYHWQKQLKAKVEQTLRAYANPNAIADNVGKKAPAVSPKPSVSRTVSKRSPSTKAGSFPRPQKIVDLGYKASFSPDGKRLVFCRPQNKGLRVLELRNGKRTNLTSSGLDPAWSPDGRFIAYVERELDMRSEEVWLVAPDGKSPRKLADGGYPSWSGDGKLLYVHSRKTNSILAINMNNLDAEPKVFCDFSWSWYPAISPDGRRIAFGRVNALAIADRATRKAILKWATPGSPGLLPAWSPDGKQVAFGGFNNENLGLWVLDVETEKAVQVATGPYTMPAWSKDGTKLAFDFRSGNQREIWMVETKALAALKPSFPAKSNLNRLHLHDRQISDADLVQYLKEFRTLHELMLENTSISDASLARIKGFTSLQVLLLGNTNITDAGLGDLKDLAALKRLCLHNTRIGDAGLAKLQGLTSLESLCLHHTDITDAGLVHLQGLSSLKALHVNDTKVTGAAANALRRLLPNMAAVKLKPKPAQVKRPGSPLIDKTLPDTSRVSPVESNKADNATAKLKVLSESPAISDIVQIRTLIEAGADVNVRNRNGVTPLMMASKMGCVEVVKLLLKAKADVNARQSNGWSALFDAVAENYVEVVQCLTENGADINTRDSRGRTVLGFAAYLGYDAIVRILLENGAEVDIRYRRTQETPLIAACQEGRAGVVKLLLDHGADVNAQRTDGENALHMATWNEHADVVRILLPYNPTPNMRGPRVKTLLMWACEKNNLELFEALLELPVDVNAKNNQGSTALIVASLVGNSRMVAELLFRGADVHVKASDSGYSGQTALMAASLFGDPEVAKQVLSQSVGRAGMTQANVEGLSALDFAPVKSRLRVIQLLLDAGAHVNQQRSDGVTSLIIASQGGNIDVVKTLLDGGADVNLRANDGGTALIPASASGHAAIVALLLENGADVRAKRKGSTALIEASFNDHTDVVRILLIHGLDVDARSDTGLTALMAACGKGHIDTARALIELGANVNLKGHMDKTALMTASFEGRAEMVRLLVTSGAKVNVVTSDGKTSLLTGSHQGHLDVVKALLNAGAEGDTKDQLGRTALMEAAFLGHADIVRQLIEHGADVNLADKKKGTALIFAAMRGHVEAVEIILSKTVDVNARDLAGQTALMLATKRGYVEIINALLSHKADPNVKDQAGYPILTYAIRLNHLPIIKSLVRHGADVNAQGPTQSTPLMAASVLGFDPIVDFLIVNGADVHAKIDLGLNSLMSAAMHGHAATVRKLLDYGADINAQADSLDALLMATYKGSTDTVKVLLEYAINRDIPLSSVDTALIDAARRGYLEIVVLLLKYGANIPIVAIDLIEPIIRLASGNEAFKKRLHEKLKQTQKAWLDNGMPISPAEVKAYYEKVRDGRYKEDVKVEFSLIDLQPAEFDPSLVGENETRQDAAQRVAAELKKRIAAGESFSQLAQEHSHGSRGFRGGLWGPIPPTSLNPPWDALAARALEMQAEEVDGPIIMKEHVFLLKLNQIHEEKSQSLQEVRGLLEKELRDDRRKKLENAIRKTRNVQ
ncbi:MAG: hypothetical protein GY809_09045 [Planctomycetes bacterium]|nr:hypothetical protein [Planctomycetota bacterium]